MLFKDFTKKLEQIENISGRNEMINTLAQLVQELSAEESRAAAYLIQGQITPSFDPLEFNIASKMVIRALSVTFSKPVEYVAARFQKKGDLGGLAEGYRKEVRQESVSLSLQAVYDRLFDIATYSGAGSQDRKIIGIKDLMLDLDPLSCRYVARMLVGKLRLGVSAKSMLDAISVAEVGDKSVRKDIEHAYYCCSDMGHVLELYKNGGMEALAFLHSKPGIPVFPKLVERIPTTEKIIEKLGPVLAQPKFDGLRCQVHKWMENGKVKVRLFSRNLEEMTDMFPDVVAAVKQLDAESFILDSEVIAYNSETEEFFPFQKTMHRKRKHGIGEKIRAIPVAIFVFDIMYLNGEEVMNRTSLKRLKLLRSLIKEEASLIKLTETVQFDDAESLEKYFIENVSEGLEGIIVKKINSIYEPGTRNFEWVKLKRAMKGHLSDTVDAVVMGYYAGRGRLAKFGVGAILIGVRDKEVDKYVTIAKVGTGITDALWQEIYETLSPLCVGSKPSEYLVDKNMEPDFWISPEIVSEVRADEITRSPIHTCGRDKYGVGYALRFPRMEIFRRDKIAEDCTSVREVISLFKNQVTPK